MTTMPPESPEPPDFPPEPEPDDAGQETAPIVNEPEINEPE